MSDGTNEGGNPAGNEQPRDDGWVQPGNELDALHGRLVEGAAVYRFRQADAQGRLEQAHQSLVEEQTNVVRPPHRRLTHFLTRVLDNIGAWKNHNR